MQLWSNGNVTCAVMHHGYQVPLELLSEISEEPPLVVGLTTPSASAQLMEVWLKVACEHFGDSHVMVVYSNYNDEAAVRFALRHCRTRRMILMRAYAQLPPLEDLQADFAQSTGAVAIDVAAVKQFGGVQHVTSSLDIKELVPSQLHGLIDLCNIKLEVDHGFSWKPDDK